MMYLVMTKTNLELGVEPSAVGGVSTKQTVAFNLELESSRWCQVGNHDGIGDSSISSITY